MAHERRIFIDQQLAAGDVVAPSAKDANHLKQVLRLSVGAAITVVDTTNSTEFDGILCALSPQVEVKLIAPRAAPQEPTKHLGVDTLIFALCRNPVNDLVCEKAAELGVRSLIFWQAARSVVTITARDLASKTARWSKIAESAAKQSGKNFIMDVQVTSTLEDLLAKLTHQSPRAVLRVCCSLAEGAVPIQKLAPITAPVQIVVGPAGDLTDEEEQAFVRAGFTLTSLGPHLLRAETAAVAAIAMVQALQR